MLPVRPATEQPRGTSFAGELVLAPLSARGTPWMRRLGNLSDAFASGLMRVRGVRRQRCVRSRFVLSDHADWPALLHTIEETGARRVLATHGHAEPLARFLAEQGLAERHDPDGVGRRAERRLMIRFARLFDEIDQTTSTNAKVAAMARYFAEAPPADAAWAVFFLTGRRLKRLLPSARSATGRWRPRVCSPGARGVLRRRRRRRRDRRADPRPGCRRRAHRGPAARAVGRGTDPAAAADGSPARSRRGSPSWWALARSAAALHPAEAADRRAARRRVADARRPGAGAGGRAAGDLDRGAR